jgi:small subunit ribosomal protein S17
MAGKTEQTSEPQNGHKNEKVGEVVSTKMQKTIVVQVSRRVPHPLYRRIVMKHKKFYAHDEENTTRREWVMWCGLSNAAR